MPLRAGAHFRATRHPEAQDHQQRQNCAGSQRYRPQEFGPKAVYVHLRSMMRFYSKRKVTIRLRPLAKAGICPGQFPAAAPCLRRCSINQAQIMVLTRHQLCGFR